MNLFAHGEAEHITNTEPTTNALPVILGFTIVAIALLGLVFYILSKRSKNNKKEN